MDLHMSGVSSEPSEQSSSPSQSQLSETQLRPSAHRNSPTSHTGGRGEEMGWREKSHESSWMRWHTRFIMFVSSMYGCLTTENVHFEYGLIVKWCSVLMITSVLFIKAIHVNEPLFNVGFFHLSKLCSLFWEWGHVTPPVHVGTCMMCPASTKRFAPKYCRKFLILQKRPHYSVSHIQILQNIQIH